jgi:hypothetical protein
MELVLGPLFQLTPVFALRTKAHLRVANGDSANTISPTVTPAYVTRFTVPISLSGVWSIHRQWDLDFIYRFSGIGYTNGYNGHTGNLVVKHYW